VESTAPIAHIFGFQTLFLPQSLDEQIPLNLAYVTKHQNLSTEPKANWKEVEYIMPAESFQTTSEEERFQAFSRMRSSGSSISKKSFRRGSSLLARSFRDSISKIGNGMLVDLIMHSERPTQLHSIHDLEDNEVSTTGCMKPPINRSDFLSSNFFLYILHRRLQKFSVAFCGRHHPFIPRLAFARTPGTCAGLR